MSCLFFLFLIWFEGNFILEQSDKQQLSSFLSFHSFFFLFFLDWLSSCSLFYCLFDDGQAFVKLLFQLPGNRFLENETPFEQRNTAKLTHQMWCPLSERSEGHMWFCSPSVACVAVFMWTHCSGFNAFLISAFHWILLSLCIEMHPQTYNKPWPLSFAFSGVFVLSRFSLPLLAQHWKFFC